MVKRGGFTLLEVLLVTALLAGVASYSIAVYRNYGKGIELGAVQKNLVYDLRQMQTRAASGENRRNWGAHFVNGTQDYYELFSTPTTYADPSKTAVSLIYFPSTITFTSPTEGNNFDIIFSSISGGASANSVTIGSEGNNQTISVTASGAVY